MANSFKQMTKSGLIKRTDTGMFISLNDIHVREGFNKRHDDDERTRLADDDLFQYLMKVVQFPRLKLSHDEGGVWVVEGHRRSRFYARCAEVGNLV